MRAVRLFGIDDLRLSAPPEPEPGPGELLVRVEAAGICGTDRHLARGEFPCTPPVILGHEFCGTVAALGPGTAGPAVGTRVTCDPNIACGACPPCLAGRVNLCLNLRAVGIHRDGGFADLAAIPAHRALPLPAAMDPDHGAFCEPLACCVHALDVAAVRPGMRVAVLGGGVIGLLCQQLARLGGADVLTITRQAAKRGVALATGAAHAAATVEDALAVWPFGADVVLECAGVAATVRDAPRLAARGGRVVIVGVLAQGARVEIEPFDLLFREVSLLTAFVNPFTQGRAAALIAEGRVDPAPLITRRVGLEEAARVIAADPGPGEIKVIVHPG